MKDKLSGKVVLITGASSGIGADFAKYIAKDRCHIILVARRTHKLNKIKAIIEESGSTAEVHSCDLSIPEEIPSLFQKLTKEHMHIDVVLNNAGLGYVNPLEKLKNDEIKQMIDLNILAMILVAKECAKIFKKQGFGHLLFTSSVAGVVTLPQWSVYVASKWAITAFADSIRSEFKNYRSKVTTIHPGPVQTEFFDEGKANISDSELGGKPVPVRKVSEKIYNATLTRKKRVYIPGYNRTLALFYRLFPGIIIFLTSKVVTRKQG